MKACMKRLLLVAALTACNGPAGLSVSQPPQSVHGLSGSSPITHVVIIVQENRSVDNLFQFLPGANTQSWGYNSHGQQVTLKAEDLTAPFDMNHQHGDFLTSYAGGAMNGFNLVGCAGECREATPYGYVPQAEVQPYYDMAEQYAFANDMFQSNEGPTFAAHQYLISGTSTISDGSSYVVDNNPGSTSEGKNGGCDSKPSSTAPTININNGNAGSPVFPCFQRETLMQLIAGASSSYTWRYYQETGGSGLKYAPDAIRSIWDSPNYAKEVRWPSNEVLKDIAYKRLATVSWVTPSQSDSDHPKDNKGTGPAWVASIVNAIGESSYWDDTAIFVTWDDWGGWYDHVTPTIYNANELGFRVPLIVISAYTPEGYISTKQHEFGSILKYTEKTFGLPSLGTTDSRSDDLSDCFNYNTSPRTFVPIKASPSASYFLHLRPETKPLDD
jgi:phospholipase C